MEGRREDTKCLSEELHYRKNEDTMDQCPIYGEILHSCAEVFSRAKDTDPGNERFITHFFVHCCMPNDLFIRPYI